MKKIIFLDFGQLISSHFWKVFEKNVFLRNCLMNKKASQKREALKLSTKKHHYR
jgi:hypothetical protein